MERSDSRYGALTETQDVLTGERSQSWSHHREEWRFWEEILVDDLDI